MNGNVFEISALRKRRLEAGLQSDLMQFLEAKLSARDLAERLKQAVHAMDDVRALAASDRLAEHGHSSACRTVRGRVGRLSDLVM